MSEDFKPPTWAGRPTPGLHLDVVKNGSVLQKLLVDERPFYVFGRSRESCDFVVQHQSCSRQHAALVHHKHLQRPFIIDLGSTHGTFIGSQRLEPQKPTQVPVDTTLRFGASTRLYTLRERPQPIAMVTDESGASVEGEGGTLLGLPDLDNEVDDLTQYNTAHNRQISTVGIATGGGGGALGERAVRRKSRSVSFAEDEEVINPEDIDPSVGRFRNMVQTTIIPAAKRPKLASVTSPTSPTAKFTQPLRSPPGLYDPAHPDSPSSGAELTSPSALRTFGSGLLAKGISSAPPVVHPSATPTSLKLEPPAAPPYPPTGGLPPIFAEGVAPKKKYAKEQWPGKKPAHLLL